MNKQNKYTDAVSRFGQWLEQPLIELRTELGELWNEFRENRSRRTQARHERRSRRRMRRAVFGRTLLGMLIFTAVYWGFAWLTFSFPELYQIVEDILVEILLIIPGEQYLSDMPAKFVIAYLVIIVLWPLISLFRASNYLDSVYEAADGILDRDNEPRPLPGRIRDLDMKLRGIRLSIIRNEQIAREAEQRKNDLVVYLAHDLKTPLSSVIGYLSLLEELPDLPVEQRAKYTSITLDKAYRLEQLINEFFDITRFNLQSVELERNHIDLSMLLMQIADEFYPVLDEKNLTVQLHLPPQLMMVGDADKLMRVFDNLLRNAASYSYEHTEITLTAHRIGDSVEILCRNRGDQIPPQSLERLFEKFFRIDSARHSGSGGSGLGLAISRHIVELHGGTITAESTPEFTTFRILLPAAPQPLSAENTIVRKS